MKCGVRGRSGAAIGKPGPQQKKRASGQLENPDHRLRLLGGSFQISAKAGQSLVQVGLPSRL